MRIGEAAERCGLSIDTIRYYETAGLLPDIARGADGQRRFSSENVEWLILLASLRDTGMTLRTMSEFAAFYRAGDCSIWQRREILVQHSQRLVQKKQALERCEQLLKFKLSMYDKRQAEIRDERTEQP